jgi:Kef-type K+ transport system membrane component KefB
MSLHRPLRATTRITLLIAALALAPAPLWAASRTESIPGVLLVIAVMLVVGKLGGELAERLGQPAVLGELLAGVVLGASVLGVVPGAGEPGADSVHLFAELGVLFLLFEIGLETNLKEMFRVGPASLAVAAAGVLAPFAAGYGFWVMLPHAGLTDTAVRTSAIFIGATLTATSVGITARVLSDLGRMTTPEARIILGAAVIDDVIGLVILGVVSGLAAGQAVTLPGVGQALLAAIAFLVITVLLGKRSAPRVLGQVERMRARSAMVVTAVAFALALSALATMLGSALIIGAFAAGLVLAGTSQAHAIEGQVKPVAAIFTPIFFVSVGASADFGLLNPFRPGAWSLLAVAGGLTVLAIAGKIVAGWAAPWMRFRRLVVGVGMVPRGEVGLIFADIGRQAGVLSEELFGAVLLMVMATTFLAPVALRSLFGSAPPASENG